MVLPVCSQPEGTVFLSWRFPHRGWFSLASIRGGWRLAATVSLLFTNLKSDAQQPAPLPQPKPIVVAPLPKPGQAAPRPKPVTDSGSVKTAIKEADPAPRPAKAAAPKPPAVSYGTTAVPWPRGSADPAHFPKEVPRYPRARQASYSMSIQVASAFFLCDEPPEAIANFYGDFIARENWKAIPIPGPPLQGDRIVIAEKGDWTLRVDAGRNPLDGATEVFLNVALKPLPPPAGKAEGKAP